MEHREISREISLETTRACTASLQAAVDETSEKANGLFQIIQAAVDGVSEQADRLFQNIQATYETLMQSIPQALGYGWEFEKPLLLLDAYERPIRRFILPSYISGGQFVTINKYHCASVPCGLSY